MQTHSLRYTWLDAFAWESFSSSGISKNLHLFLNIQAFPEHLCKRLLYQKLPKVVHEQRRYFNESIRHPFHRFQKSETAVDSEVVADRPVICEAKNSFTCSVVLDTESSHLMMVTVSGCDARAPSVLLRIPARPGETVFACLMHAMFI